MRVFEKSRSLSGRCATRLWQGHVVDHGAQYFTARNPEFRQDLHRLFPQALRTLEAPIFAANGREVPAENSERWYHLSGNSRLGNALLADAPGVQLEKEHTLQHLRRHGSRWELHFAEGPVSEADVVVLSLPAPQAARLLDFPREASRLFVPCLTAFFLLEGEWPGNTREAYARYYPDGLGELWTACENHKFGRVQGPQTVLIAQASAQWSAQHLEAEPSQWIAQLGDLAAKAWGVVPQWQATFGHRWRFARRVAELPALTLPSGIFSTGDSRAVSRIEDVWLAGAQTAAEVETWLGN